MITRSQANKATAALRQPQDDEEFQEALHVAQEWRAQHLEPAQECLEKISSLTASINPDIINVFRLKRMESIIMKLRRNGYHFKLGELDDIGGCRIITDTMEQLQAVQQRLEVYKDTAQGFTMKRPPKDYINHPRDADGYRCCHYFVKIAVPHTNFQYYIEVQLRTTLQHLWATSLEAAALALHEPDLKTSKEKFANPLAQSARDFFIQVSRYFRLEEEHAVTLQTLREIRNAVSSIPQYEAVLNYLTVFSGAISNSVIMREVFSKGGQPHLVKGYYVLDLDISEQFMMYQYYTDSQLDSALQQYKLYEQQTAPLEHNTVLIAAHTAESMKLAYPNYFGGIAEFLDRVQACLP